MSDLVGRLSVLQVLLAEHHPDHHATVREAIAELERLRADLAESYRVNGRLSDLLTHTANALKGEPGELFSHSTHDLPERARAVVAERDHLSELIRFEQSRFARLLRVLSGIHMVMYPPLLKLDDGRTMGFCPEHPNDYLQALSDRIRAIPDEIEAIEKAEDQDTAEGEG